MRNVIKSRLVNVLEAFFGISFSVLRMSCTCFVWWHFHYEQTLTEFEMSWIERRVISFFIKISGLRWLFSIIGVRTQQVWQKLDKVDVFWKKKFILYFFMVYLYLDASLRTLFKQKWSPGDLMHSSISKSEHSRYPSLNLWHFDLKVDVTFDLKLVKVSKLDDQLRKKPFR